VFIREAVRRHCDEVLGSSLLYKLGDIVGSVEIDGYQSRRTGQAFAALLRTRSKRREG
jgi:hypothetical protein